MVNIIFVRKQYGVVRGATQLLPRDGLAKEQMCSYLAFG